MHRMLRVSCDLIDEESANRLIMWMLSVVSGALTALAPKISRRVSPSRTIARPRWISLWFSSAGCRATASRILALSCLIVVLAGRPGKRMGCGTATEGDLMTRSTAGFWSDDVVTFASGCVGAFPASEAIMLRAHAACEGHVPRAKAAAGELANGGIWNTSIRIRKGCRSANKCWHVKQRSQGR